MEHPVGIATHDSIIFCVTHELTEPIRNTDVWKTCSAVIVCNFNTTVAEQRDLQKLRAVEFALGMKCTVRIPLHRLEACKNTDGDRLGLDGGRVVIGIRAVGVIQCSNHDRRERQEEQRKRGEESSHRVEWYRKKHTG